MGVCCSCHSKLVVGVDVDALKQRQNVQRGAETAKGHQVLLGAAHGPSACAGDELAAGWFLALCASC